jgi:hypothetical protein
MLNSFINLLVIELNPLILLIEQIISLSSFNNLLIETINN